VSDAGQVAQPGGPVRPTASAVVAHRPVTATGTRLTSGLLRDWQWRSRVVSLPLAMTQMEAAGNLGNLRLAVAGEHEGYRGPAFMDSDVYKTLEAVAWELGRGETDDTGAAALAAFFSDTTALLEKAQCDDGYLNSHVQVTGKPRYAHLAYSHELYCAGHLIQAAIAGRRAAAAGPGLPPDAAERLFWVATRFADHLVTTFLGHQGNDGHPIIETALAELYRETGETDYLRLAAQFIDQRGHGLIGDSGFGSRYLQDHEPVRESRTEVGHAVRALYLEAGVADVAAEGGDGELLAASWARWSDMVATKTALTGGNGSRHSGEAFGDAFELPPDRAYNETCAAIASFQWSWRMLLATGDARYADLMETILYNGFGASVSADGQRFFYVNPLQRRADHFENDHPGRRRAWFSCACCPPNIMRLLASVQHYLATVAGNAVYLHQLAGSQISAELPAGDVALAVRTGYPWDGSAEIEVTAAPGGEFGLAVRVPEWSARVQLAVNGEPVGEPAADRGYLVVTRAWAPGDVLAAAIDLTPALIYPSRRIDALRGTAALRRGPLVYCFEQADQGAVSVEDLAINGGALAERPGAPGLEDTVAVTVSATHLAPPGGPYAAAPDPSAAGGPPATAIAIPYFQWDNRDGGPMRVWLPRHDAQAAASGGEPADPEPDRVPRPRRMP
jgi:DUF1680 family protein